MSYFMAEPVRILETKADLESALANPEWFDNRNQTPYTIMHKWQIKSLWLIALIDEIEASGQYPYNATVNKLAQERLGYPPKSDREYANEGTPLSCLIYNAHKYRDDDRLRAVGFVPLTQDLLESLPLGTCLETPNGRKAKVRIVNGKRYAMEWRKRRVAISPQGNPVKIVKGDSKVAA